MIICKRLFTVTVLIVWCCCVAKSQADCIYGYKVYVLDNHGRRVANAKLEVTSSTEADKLSPALQNFQIREAYFVGFVMRGCSYPGNFILRVSADGLKSYERPITFTEGLVACELRLQPAASNSADLFLELATAGGKIVDENKLPYRGAHIEAISETGRIHLADSDEYGNYEFDLPKGVYKVRVTSSDTAPIILEKQEIQSKFQRLDVTVCRTCQR
ncbi:MAG TPA: carboxypeptidase-like regulatory domain-containing protein [Pyrinomonadaceae bacterium]|nr:carboxypeptidase-like regulatory domain-containing protein [Pyrinomonadaceae bacterium]